MGYFFYFSTGDASKAAQIAQQMRDLGIRWIRLPYVWRFYDQNGATAPDMSQPSWLNTQDTEAFVNAFNANGIRVMLQVGDPPQWGSTDPSETQSIMISSYLTAPVFSIVPPVMDAWAMLNFTLAQRLEDKVSAWEVWNEPESPLFFEPKFYPGSRTVPGTEFNHIVQMAALSIKTVDPAAKVVVNYAGSYSDTDFTTTFLPGTKDYVDVYGRHYSDGATDVTDTQKILHQYSIVGKPFWDTESRGTDSMLFARWLSQRAQGAEKVFPFIYHFAFNEVGSDFARFGTNPVGPDYVIRPKGAAIRTLSDMLGNAQFVKTLKHVSLRKDYLTYVFRKEGRDIVVLLRNDASSFWDTSQRHLAVFTVLGKFNNRADLKVTDLMGNRTHVTPKLQRIVLPTVSNPMFIEGLKISEKQPPLRFRRFE